MGLLVGATVTAGILYYRDRFGSTNDMAPTIPDLTDDTNTAKEELDPHCVRLLGLVQLWNIFTSAKQIADIYISNFDDLSYQAKLSFTKSIVIDYAKPWTGNRSTALRAIKDAGRYSFLSDVENKPLHSEILELRNRLVAHIDEGYEGLSVTLAGGTVENIPPNRPRDEGTLQDVFVPTVVRLASLRGMWWIQGTDKLQDIKNQIDEALKATQEEITTAAKAFLEASLNHMHVLKHLPDVVKVHEFPAEDFNIQVQPFAENPGSINTEAPVTLEFGDGNIQSLVAIYESTPGYAPNTSVEGKGYKFEIGKETSAGTFQLNVIFPKYPHPKGAA